MQSSLKLKAENYLSRYPKVFFCHIPKCAGVSLSNAIHSSLYPALFKATRLSSNIDLQGSKVSSELLDIDMTVAREVQLTFFLSDKYKKFITGHCPARPSIVSKFEDNWRFITVLRDPHKRFVSEFVYNKFKESDWGRHEEDIESYLESKFAKHSATTYARYFSKFHDVDQILQNKDEAIESSIKNLKKFSVVGTLENLSEWETKFNSFFETKIRIANKNSSPNKELSQELYKDERITKKIEELNIVDNAIYEAVRDNII
ncbi:sulfotransferase family 2 domain-containing protein [Alteromonas mediterranea]|uniref:sulfotransferase family 2 domain-containing protein n=1 Tax=Alteromonas mediterranea TaxID=314275 RepID=UPI0003558030|nr:sulfotransferase family 2 domain-containing protein [Alteromonas mediterranea]AGP84009.1 Sulfotransferase family protein [Alteromonas mediterranea U4]AGP88082.1 Sulfotransferase family protein [Alteromonas mediterranea U7]AGP93578.1 Sulfotransferase family protein [Alteromonas mediterranea U8]